MDELRRRSQEIWACRPGADTFRELVFSRWIPQLFPGPAERRYIESTKLYQELLTKAAKLEAMQRCPNRPRIATMTVRLPASEHRLLKEEAWQRKTSLNQLCVAKLRQPLPSGSEDDDQEQAT